MPVDEPYNVYRVQLSSLYNGCALWEPEPVEGLYDEVSIGDVGYIHNGFFYRMFNATLPWDDPSNQKFGEDKPEHYLPLKQDEFLNIHASRFEKGDYNTPNVLRQRNTNNIQAENPRDAEGATYQCQGLGALLSIPDDGCRKDVIRTKVFEEHIRDNVASWFSWSQKRGFSAVERMEDLILVTGHTLVTSWATAAFLDRTGKAEISLIPEPPKKGRRSFDCNNSQGAVRHHCSVFNSDTSLRLNQCIFIRGFRAKRVLPFRTRLRAAAEPLPDDPDNRREDEIQVTVTTVPDASKYRDPLVGVLDYIVEKCPEGTIAIAHDHDLQLVEQVGILTADVVENFLRQNQFEVLVENGAASLHPYAPSSPESSSVPSLSSSLSPYPSTSYTSVYTPSHTSVYNPSHTNVCAPSHTSVHASLPISRVHATPQVPPIFQARTLLPVSPAPLTPIAFLLPALAPPSLDYDMRYPPTPSNPHLSFTTLDTPASSPPLPSLSLRVGDLPWLFKVSPDAELSPSPENAYVTVHDVLLAIYYHLRAPVKKSEYDAMSKSRKAAIYREFERRVSEDPVQLGKGLRRIDFLNGRFHAQGLVRAMSKESVWEVVVH